MKTPGPQVFRISGQVYHNTYSLNPDDDKSRKYGQLYIIDNEMANNIRSTNDSNKNFSLEVLKELDDLLRIINPHARAYKMMHEVEMEENERAKKKQ